MAAKERFPLFLSNHAEEPWRPDTGTSWKKVVSSTRILKASVFGIAAAAIVFAAVAVENPLLFGEYEFLASVKAFLVPPSRPQQDTSEATPVTQSDTMAQPLPPVANEAPASDETAAPFKAAGRSETETRQPPAEDLLGQFQSWAAGENARAEAAPARDVPAQPVQDVEPQPVQPSPGQDASPIQNANPVQSARPVQRANPVQNANSARDARAPIRPAQKRQAVRHVRNAPSEQNLRAKGPPEQHARPRPRPPRDARAQEEPPLQNSRTPTFLESLGFRDPGSRE